MLTLDISNLTQEQLHVLATTVPEARLAVADELERRSAYPTLNDAFTDLALVVAKVDHFLETTKHTQSVKAFIEMGVPSVLRRVLATARVNKWEYKEPDLEDIMK